MSKNNKRYINTGNSKLSMDKKVSFQIKDLLPVKEIKEDINLALFNSPNFSTEDMKFTNQLMEEFANMKIQINTCNQLNYGQRQ